MNPDRLKQLTDYLFAVELRAMHYSQLDIAEILVCHERAHLNTMVVIVEMSEGQISKLLES